MTALERQTHPERNVELLAELPVAGSTATSAEIIEAIRDAREGRAPELDAGQAPPASGRVGSSR